LNFSLQDGGDPESMLSKSREPIIDVREDSLKRFSMITFLFGEATGFSKRAPIAMTQATIIPLYPHRILLTNTMRVLKKRAGKTIPIIAGNTIITHSQTLKALSESPRRFLVPLAPHIGDYPATRTVVRIDKPYFTRFLPHIRPKLIYFQRIVMFWRRSDLPLERGQYTQYFGNTYTRNRTYITYPTATDEHTERQRDKLKTPTGIALFKGRYKLIPTAFALIVLFLIAFLAVLLYTLPMTMGAGEFYGSRHNSIVLRRAPFVFTPAAYFLDHLLQDIENFVNRLCE
jgi:hypothetical protein